MFHKQDQFTPAHISGILKAAEAAARDIPPAFPLDATVAVNPFMGQLGEDLATASARLARVAGVRITRERAAYARAVAEGTITDDDLTEALGACPHSTKPANLDALKSQLATDSPAPRALPTVAHLAAHATGTDWPALIDRCFGLWAAAYFDRGQALWTPAPGHSAFAGWREWATHDLTPEIAGLTGFCAHVASAPDTPRTRHPARCRPAGADRGYGGIGLSPLADGYWRLVATRALAAVAGRACWRFGCHDHRPSGDPAGLGRGIVGACPASRETLGADPRGPCRPPWPQAPRKWSMPSCKRRQSARISAT